MSKNCEAIRKLKQAGFRMKKAGTKHDLWTNGRNDIIVPKNSRITNIHSVRSLNSQIRKFSRTTIR